MKLGIISDTHDNLDAVRNFVEIFKKEEIDFLIHAGDIVSPFVIDIFSQLNIPQKYVFGNNDGEKLFLKEKISKIGDIKKGPILFEITGKKIILMHEPFEIDALAKSGKYNLIIYGHTHQFRSEKIDNTFILNPGEACGYLTGKKSAIIFNMKEETVEKITL